MTKPPIPTLADDAEALRFVATSHLTDHDLSALVETRIVLGPRVLRLRLDLPVELVTRLRARARSDGVSVTRYVRRLLERDERGGS